MGQSVHGDERCWVGIDIGTQSVRAVVVADDGTVLGTGSSPLTSRRSAGGRHEQDPDTWWEAVGVATRSAVTGSVRHRVAGVAACGTSGTVLLVADTAADPAAGRSVALMYDDARAADEAEAIQRDPAPVWAHNGVTPQRTWALPKAIWLARQTTDSTGLRLAHQVDVINSRLAGHPVATDTSNALKTGVDPVTADWPRADLQRLGLNVSLLPEPRRPGSRLGEVCQVAAEHTGLPAGVPIVAGMTDGCAAQIAAGVLKPGQWNFVIGTTIVLKGVTDELLGDPSGALYSHYSPDRRWWPGGASNAGAAVLAKDYDSARLDELDAAAARREPAGCVVYPLSATGERFPFRRAEAQWLQLGEPRDEADRYAAILQGVAYVQRLCLDHVSSLGGTVGRSVTVTGGAARSRYWPQLQADVLGREVRVPRLAEGALGMAILAAAGNADLSETAARMAGPVTTYHPRPGSAARFTAGYERLVTALLERDWIRPALADAVLTGAR